MHNFNERKRPTKPKLTTLGAKETRIWGNLRPSSGFQRGLAESTAFKKCKANRHFVTPLQQARAKAPKEGVDITFKNDVFGNSFE
jgi:hypothetical protein